MGLQEGHSRLVHFVGKVNNEDTAEGCEKDSHEAVDDEDPT